MNVNSIFDKHLPKTIKVESLAFKISFIKNKLIEMSLMNNKNNEGIKRKGKEEMNL